MNNPELGDQEIIAVCLWDVFFPSRIFSSSYLAYATVNINIYLLRT